MLSFLPSLPCKHVYVPFVHTGLMSWREYETHPYWRLTSPRHLQNIVGKPAPKPAYDKFTLRGKWQLPRQSRRLTVGSI